MPAALWLATEAKGRGWYGVSLHRILGHPKRREVLGGPHCAPALHPQPRLRQACTSPRRPTCPAPTLAQELISAEALNHTRKPWSSFITQRNSKLASKEAIDLVDKLLRCVVVRGWGAAQAECRGVQGTNKCLEGCRGSNECMPARLRAKRGGLNCVHLPRPTLMSALAHIACATPAGTTTTSG